ncbi:MAG: flagellar biosynthesis protein FliQ [Gammaproteobacteria bacterium]|nr:flagellar biosynthesis protein FliQ [Gammaproteobacteria bacterium]
MTPEFVLTIGRQAVEVTLAMLMLILIPALAVGLLISMFQAATQINEVTLSFIPKLIVTFLVILFGGPWLLSTLMGFTQRLFETIPEIIS